MNYSADFETNNSESECRVWSWGLCGIEDTSTYMYGQDIYEFIELIKQMSYDENFKIWFHNLSFDGSFILNALFRLGYTWTDKRILPPNHFSTLISDMGQWYSIKINFGNSEKTGIVIIQDSLKILPFSVSQVAKSFGLPESKGKIDYDTIRPKGYQPTLEEKEYQKTDCLIMAKALSRMQSEGMKRMTAGSNALAYYKKITDKRQFEKWFPELDCDEFIRKSYRGGWVYANPKYRGKKQGKGIVLDVNSLYPSRMRYELLPYGMPTYYTGMYHEDDGHPLYVQHLKCSFVLKPGKLPTVQIKGTSRFLDSEYVTTSNGEIVELTLTSVDLKLFLEHYKVAHLQYIDGYKFKGQYHMFDTYVDYWIQQKIDAEKSGDKAGRTLAKLYQNSLYGKFAKRPEGQSKIPYLENGILKFRLSEPEEQGKLYIPIGTFITAYARNYTIRAAQSEYKRFMYADTDSLHLKGLKEPENLEVDKYKLGAWKHESTFEEAIYVGSKCYVEKEIHTKEEIEKYLKENPENDSLISWRKDKEKGGFILKITCSGLPSNLHRFVTIDTFGVGLKIEGKLRPRQVPGGCILEKTTFEIKERNHEKKITVPGKCFT